MFEKLKVDSNVKDTQDKIFGAKPSSDVYDATIDMAYIDKAKSGATFVSLSLVLSSGFSFNTKQYVLSGDSKGNKPTYTSNNEEHMLAGYVIMRDIYALTLNKALETIDEDTEEKMVNIYDYESKSNVPTEKAVVVPLIGQKIQLGLLIVKENEKDRNNNFKDIPGTSRELITVDRVFNEDGQTIHEVKANSPAEFITAWLNQNKDKVLDKRKIKDANPIESAAPAATDTPAPSKKKLFS